MAPMENAYNESMNTSGDKVTDAKWIKMFPQCVADSDQSSNFMTRALYLVFSTILNRRQILGGEYFTKSYITEKLKCTGLSFQNPKGLQISQLLRNAGSAIKLGFLKEIALVLTNNENDDDAIEVYSFRVHYFKNEGVAVQLNTTMSSEQPSPFEKLTELEYAGTTSVRDSLIMLVRSSIFLCEKVLEPLPAEYYANFRVDYTDSAPADYTVEGFSDASTFYTLPKDIQSATLGQLRPGHHGGLMECMSNFIVDTYDAELKLKKYTEKIADKLGYNACEQLYKSFSFDATNTTSEVIKVHDSSLENLSKSLAKNATLTPIGPTKPGSQNKESTTRSAPYPKRNRK